MQKILKPVLIIVAIIVVAIVAYSFITPKGDQSDEALRSTTNQRPATMNESDTVSREFLVTLLNLNALSLNGAIFNRPSFRLLQDYSVILIPEGNEGRPNPFAPLGFNQEIQPTTDDEETE